MLKALLLQSWYGLSDPCLEKEKQLARDLLFRRFVDLSLSESVPDHSTLWRFRNLLEKSNLLETLLSEINDPLAHKGLLIRSGEVSIIDASVIKAKQNRPKKDKNGNNTHDPEAGYNVKQGSNRINSGVRSIVERVFGVLKLHYGRGNARYLGLSRNKTRFGLMSLAYNIKRVSIASSMRMSAG